jgi:hypothetical protein
MQATQTHISCVCVCVFFVLILYLHHIWTLWFLLHILDVRGSNFNPDINYPDWGFSWSSSVPLSKCLYSTSTYAMTASFPSHYLSVILAFNTKEFELFTACYTHMPCLWLSKVHGDAQQHTATAWLSSILGRRSLLPIHHLYCLSVSPAHSLILLPL